MLSAQFQSRLPSSLGDGFLRKKTKVQIPIVTQFTKWILCDLCKNSVHFVLFCVKASEWQFQKNVLSHESLRMKDFEKNMLGGGQEL